jgi:hypothetical protein
MKLPLSVLIFAALVAVAGLAWLGWTQLRPAPAAGAPQPEGGLAGQVVLDSMDDMPDWLLVARQRDCRARGAADQRCLGEVHFNQRTITRNSDGTADIWIQVRHGVRQSFMMESETSETMIRFELERLRYRFNCTTAEFIVVERLIMGPRNTIIARDAPEPIYRAPARGSVTGIIQPIACRGT